MIFYNHVWHRYLNLYINVVSSESLLTFFLQSSFWFLQVDFDDGNCPTYYNQIKGIYNVFKAVHNLFPSKSSTSPLSSVYSERHSPYNLSKKKEHYIVFTRLPSHTYELEWQPGLIHRTSRRFRSIFMGICYRSSKNTFVRRSKSEREV